MIRHITQGLSPYELVFKNFFDAASEYTSVSSEGDVKHNYPVNIGVADEALILQIACVGVNPQDIKIQKSRDTLRLKYSRQADKDSKINWVSKKISRSSFDLGYKISAKYDLEKLETLWENGLLTIKIPIAEGEQFQEVEIKVN